MKAGVKRFGQTIDDAKAAIWDDTVDIEERLESLNGGPLWTQLIDIDHKLEIERYDERLKLWVEHGPGQGNIIKRRTKGWMGRYSFKDTTPPDGGKRSYVCSEGVTGPTDEQIVEKLPEHAFHAARGVEELMERFKGEEERGENLRKSILEKQTAIVKQGNTILESMEMDLENRLEMAKINETVNRMEKIDEKYKGGVG
jgi:hypothetical protein